MKVVFGHERAVEDCIIACAATVQGPKSYVDSRRCEGRVVLDVDAAGGNGTDRLPSGSSGCCNRLRHLVRILGALRSIRLVSGI